MSVTQECGGLTRHDMTACCFMGPRQHVYNWCWSMSDHPGGLDDRGGLPVGRSDGYSRSCCLTSPPRRRPSFVFPRHCAPQLAPYGTWRRGYRTVTACWNFDYRLLTGQCTIDYRSWKKFESSILTTNQFVGLNDDMALCSQGISSAAPALSRFSQSRVSSPSSRSRISEGWLQSHPNTHMHFWCAAIYILLKKAKKIALNGTTRQGLLSPQI